MHLLNSPEPIRDGSDLRPFCHKPEAPVLIAKASCIWAGELTRINTLQVCSKCFALAQELVQSDGEERLYFCGIVPGEELVKRAQTKGAA